MDSRTQLLIEKLPRPEVEELVLEEVPDVTYANVGGLDTQIEAITDAVELPYLHRDLFNAYKLPAPKGILLYGPPGCGKTLIAKAVANSLAKKVGETAGNKNIRSYFLNIKGPELLNKYVGETERQIRLVFERAREKAEEGVPVIVFFDEMDSLFRTRGTGISSDMESTIVPQLLAEIDGVETLRDVIVIGASNREDLIDPAILRPGRLDVKIKIERPDEQAATQIFSRYLTSEVPLDAADVERLGGGDPDKAAAAMIEATVAEMYREDEDNRFLEVTYQNGDKEVLFYRDFASGAMIENIVRRAKKLAIKREIAGQGSGIVIQDLQESIRQEYKENEDLPNTTNPDDWARISGKKGERIVYVRTLLTEESETRGGRSIERVGTGQYLVSRDDPDRVGPWPSPRSAASRPSTASRRARVRATPSPRPRSWSMPTRPRSTVGPDGTSRTSPRARTPGALPARTRCPPVVETHLANTVLTNGARYYVDHAHPEYSCPECADPLEVVRYDKAGEEVLRRSMIAARALMPDSPPVVVYKNNSDGKGNSYGCHENYLMDRAVPFSRVVVGVVPHFVSRQIYTGARQGRHRDAGPRPPAGPVPGVPAGRVLRGGGRPRDHLEASHRQHPGRAPCRPSSVPPAPRHRGRRQPLGGGHLLEGWARPRWSSP